MIRRQYPNLNSGTGTGSGTGAKVSSGRVLIPTYLGKYYAINKLGPFHDLSCFWKVGFLRSASCAITCPFDFNTRTSNSLYNIYI